MKEVSERDLLKDAIMEIAGAKVSARRPEDLVTEYCPVCGFGYGGGHLCYVCGTLTRADKRLVKLTVSKQTAAALKEEIRPFDKSMDLLIKRLLLSAQIARKEYEDERRS